MSLLLTGLLSFVSVPPMSAQDRLEPDLARLLLDAAREWYAIAHGRKDFEVSDPGLVPALLGLAAEQAGCRYKEDIATNPVRFMHLVGRRLAIVFCPGISGSHQVFDLSNLRKPTMIALPLAVPPDGFGATTKPGRITWEKDAGVFRAETGSDVMPSPRVRHTYRFESNGFVVVRVEVQKDGVGDWATIWDAPRWALPANPN
ncbi:hypothetical protein CI41S_73980 [Bradyrhizobium ivorense]|nr:hypothetical protein CI41S_73980 [Bradyrhizobium ivorense]